MVINIKKNELLYILILTAIILTINISPISVNAAIYGMANHIEQYRVECKTQEFNVHISDHFIIRYTKDDAANIQMIINEAEKSYHIICESFTYIPKEKITIIVFPSNKDMNQILGLRPYQSSMGLYYSNFISILSPNVWMPKSEDKEEIFKTKGPILHELVHYFVDKETKGNYPQWFTEGIALYFEKQISEIECNNISLLTYSVNQLNHNFEELNQDAAYRSSYQIISKYIEKNGIEGLLNTFQKLRKGYILDEFSNL